MANKGQFKKGDARAGRKAGSTNKLTRSAKEAFAAAFDEMGGIERLVLWAKLNPTDFYKLYARLIPVELSGEIQARITVSDDIPPAQ